jgi:ATP-dependent DNA ligase
VYERKRRRKRSEEGGRVFRLADLEFRVGEGSKDPDVWFEPTVVWEVKAADLSISPVHQAGIGLLSEDKGRSF